MYTYEETIEAEIITRNEPMLKQIVAVFMRKVRASSRGGMIDREDMLQEVKLCFMLEVRRYGEDIAITHKRTLYHALYQAAIAAQPVKISYHAYARIRRQEIIVEEWDEQCQAAQRTEEAFSIAAFRETMERLEAQEREIISLRLEGLKQREIGQRIGLSDVQVSRMMKRIRRQFTGNIEAS